MTGALWLILGMGVGVYALRLASGQTATCHWFNVPENLAGNTGAITVYKYACPVTRSPAASPSARRMRSVAVVIGTTT